MPVMEVPATEAGSGMNEDGAKGELLVPMARFKSGWSGESLEDEVWEKRARLYFVSLESNAWIARVIAARLVSKSFTSFSKSTPPRTVLLFNRNKVLVSNNKFLRSRLTE